MCHLFVMSDERWGLAVEAAIGRQLTWWIVDWHEDRELLRSLRRQVHRPMGGDLHCVIMAYSIPPHAIPPQRQLPDDIATCLRRAPRRLRAGDAAPAGAAATALRLQPNARCK